MNDKGETGDFMRSLAVAISRYHLIYWRDLLRELVVRDIKVRYKGSVLGVAWSLVNPLLQMMVFYFLFRLVMRFNIAKYPSFVLSGVLAWGWFQSSLSQAAGVITASRDLVKRPGFRPAILPVTTVTTYLIDFLLSLPILILLLLIDDGSFHLTVFALPIVIGCQFLLTLGLAYWISMANVFFRDTQQLLTVALRLLFYLSPVFYDAKVIPAPYMTLYRLNPLVHLLDAYRAILIRGELPDGLVLLGLSMFAGALLWSGQSIFRRVSYRLIEEL
jgi:lipopolysaccharide transport system permease protein